MRHFLFALLLVVSFAPAGAEAAFGIGGQIIPLECTCDSVPVVGEGEQSVSAPAFGCILQTLQNVIRVVIGLGFVFATLALMYAGFMWMTSGGAPEKRTAGKNLLLNVFIGLFIMLAAWLIIDFVMKTLYDGEKGDFGPWNNILAGYEVDGTGERCLVVKKAVTLTDATADIVLDGPGTYDGGDGSGSHAAGKLSNSDARQLLTSADIRVTAGTLANTNADTINQVVKIKSACGCDVVVTSTTGGSHADGAESHEAGFKVDLDDTASLNTFLMNTLTRNGSRGGEHGGPRYYDHCGNEYVRETRYSHWDITVNSGACSLN